MGHQAQQADFVASAPLLMGMSILLGCWRVYYASLPPEPARCPSTCFPALEAAYRGCAGPWTAGDADRQPQHARNG